ncbi:MAG: hypothetical protein HRU38_16920 [Saccharospirillaceae bacterium]|nr:hypothetical protein [Pseudomonadales bacterium]NRB80320.1 hypothetical protein [Saccharospirillaceae bacterium]
MNKIITIIFCALLLSCQSTPIQNPSTQTTPTTQKVVIIPLTVGNKWIHTSNYGREATSEVTNTLIRNGKTWFQYIEISDTYVGMNTNEGHLEYYGSIDNKDIDIEGTNECTSLKFPVIQYEEYECDEVKISVTPNVTISVPAGSFNTYLYVFGFDNSDRTQAWYAPNIGLIKQINGSESFELIKYSIANEK